MPLADAQAVVVASHVAAGNIAKRGIVVRRSLVWTEAVSRNIANPGMASSGIASSGLASRLSVGRTPGTAVRRTADLGDRGIHARDRSRGERRCESRRD